MLEHYAALHSTRSAQGAAGLVDLSARPGSPLAADHGRRAVPRTRALVAGGLRRLAATLDPGASAGRTRRTATPACR